MSGSSPDDFASALKDRPLDQNRAHGLGGDGGNGAVRGLGLLLLGFGIVGLALSGFAIAEVQRGAESIQLNPKYLVVQPPAVLFGLLLVIGGGRAMRWLGGIGRLSWPVGGFIAASIVAALAYHVVVMNYFATHGYVFEKSYPLLDALQNLFTH